MSPLRHMSFAVALALAGCAVDRLPALVTPGATAARVEPGMSRAQVLDIVGPSRKAGRYGNGTTSLTWRYEDYGIIKLLHVIFDPSDRVQWSYTEWDPRVYSKDGGGRSNK